MYLLLLALLLVLLVSLIFVQVWAQARAQTQTQAGGDVPVGEARVFPLFSPFNRNFFYHTDKPLVVMCKPSARGQLGKLFPRQVSFRDPQIPQDNLRLLADGKIDFLLTYEYDVAPYLTNLHNVRFVTALYSSTVSILAPDSCGISDLEDIAYYSCKVKIGIYNKQARQCLYNILSVYGEAVRKNTEIIFTDNPNIEYGEKFLLYFDVTVHPNERLRALTERTPSHLLFLRRVNGGNYFVTDAESPFYKRYPYYKKDFLERDTMSKYYNLLSPPLETGRSLHLPTIKSHIVILTHKDTNDDTVRQVARLALAQILNGNALYKGITPAMLCNVNIRIPVHEAVVSLHRKLELMGRGGFYENI